ncbi:hypothetical protein [Bifidobacterium sp.]|uniref:hypothetical protein n=1 Tax=Bifidobacterium sp. TaxID=41200 RepID=UPI0039E9D901
MAQYQSAKSHRMLLSVLWAIAAVIVIVLVSAFVWPRWAIRGSEDAASTQTATSSQSTAASATPTSPTISPSALPTDASTLLKTMPDSVRNYARTQATAATTWSSSSPIEEYTVVYSTGDSAEDITLTVAQWSTSDDAKQQYDTVAATLTGDEIASGNVKVSGSATGAYVVKSDTANKKDATALWQNSTVLIQAHGEKEAVKNFYQKFPL